MQSEKKKNFVVYLNFIVIYIITRAKAEQNIKFLSVIKMKIVFSHNRLGYVRYILKLL